MAHKYPPEFASACRSYIHEGNRDALSSILEIWKSHQSVDKKASLGDVLHRAIHRGGTADVQTLLDAGVPPSQQTPWEGRATPLIIAADFGRRDIARLLWDLVGSEGRFHPEIFPSRTYSCLQVAAEAGHAALVADFLDMWSGWGADEMRGALNGAAKSWRDDVVGVLLTRGEFSAEEIQNALVASIGYSSKLANRLAGIDYSSDTEGIEERQYAVVCRLVDAGADPNGTVRGGRPMLLAAADSSGSLGVLKGLLEKGADVNVQKADDGSTPLRQYRRITAPAKHTIATAKALLEHGASPDLADHEGETAVHAIALAGTLEELKLYLDHCRDAEAALQQWESVLHYAAVGKQVDVVEFLVGRGLDVNAVSKNGWTPLVCALMPTGQRRVATSVNIANFLLKNRVCADTVTAENWTPMHSLASWWPYPQDDVSGVMPLVRELLSRGAALEVYPNVLRGKDVTGRGSVSVLEQTVSGKWGVRMQRFAQSEAERVKEVVREEDTAPHMWADRNKNKDIFQAILDHWASGQRKRKRTSRY